MKHLHNYLLFPTLSFKHILKIPLPMNALKISACQIFLPLQKYVNAITGIFRLMICIVGMKRVTSFSLIHVL